MLKGFTRKFKPLAILTEEQIEDIHRGTLDVLETAGVRVECDRGLELFADHGCKVDFDKKRVRIPSYLVEDCLSKCPSSYTVKARDPNYDLRIGGNTLYFLNMPTTRRVDLDTWESRPGTLQEHGEDVRLLDALDAVHMVFTQLHYSDMKGVAPAMAMLEAFSSGIRNSAKVQYGCYSADCEVFAIKMAKAVGMDLDCPINTSSPLTLYSDAVEAMFRFVEAGFPINIAPGPTMGGSGPATIAGSTIVANAEAMAAIVLCQLLKPGRGVMVGDAMLPMDMRSGQPVFGDTRMALHQVMFNQIWRKYGIPTDMWHCGLPGGKKIDFQAGYERSLLAMTAALSGTNMICLHGSVHGELTSHPAMSVLDDDVAGWIGHFMEGVEVTDETLAIDLIEEVGPIPGQYLDKEHTRNRWWKEQFVPKVADREPYPDWIKKGKKDALALAKERVDEILATHKPKPLTPEQDEAIDEILEEARSFYRQKGLM
jgi:trimethylamine--corrinoid protein Co-methyltransferase